MKCDYYILLLAFVIIGVTTLPIPLKNDPKRPVTDIARDLGVGPEQFTTCFNGVTPAPQGSTPTASQVHSNKQHLLSCLQNFNPAITNEKLDAVMDKSRPRP